MAKIFTSGSSLEEVFICAENLRKKSKLYFNIIFKHIKIYIFIKKKTNYIYFMPKLYIYIKRKIYMYKLKLN